MTVWAFLHFSGSLKGEFVQHILSSTCPDQQVKQIGQTQEPDGFRQLVGSPALVLHDIPIENRLLHRQRTQSGKFIRRHPQILSRRPHESSPNSYLGFPLLRSWNIELYPPPIPLW